MSATVRTVVIDDELPARRLLRELLSQWPRLEIVGEAVDGDEAIALLRREQPDLAFLDVQMPRRDGFQVLTALSPDELPIIVFVTAHDRHAVRAFEVSACDYLLKPYDDARLATAVERALDRFDHRAPALTADAIRQLLASAGAAPPQPLALKLADRHVFVDPRDIDWIEADGKGVTVYCGPRTHSVREGISQMEARLDASRFLRVHRSMIVNRGCIREVQPWFRGEYVLVLRDGTRLTTGRHYRDRVRTLLPG